MDYDKLLNFRNHFPGFAREANIDMTEVKRGYAKGEMLLDERHQNPIGSVHGGAIFTLADTVGGVAATSRGSFVTTVSGNINYLNPAIGVKKLIAETKELKAGKNILVYDVTVKDHKETVIAEARMTFYSLHKEADFNE